MRPKIEDTWFGSITVEGKRYEYDIVIRLSGKVRRRNKQLSKAVYGTSHTLSLAEITRPAPETGGADDHRRGHEGQVAFPRKQPSTWKRRAARSTSVPPRSDRVLE